MKLFIVMFLFFTAVYAAPVAVIPRPIEVEPVPFIPPIEVCQKANLKGECKTITETIYDLKTQRWSNGQKMVKIGSIRINNNRYEVRLKGFSFTTFKYEKRISKLHRIFNVPQNMLLDEYRVYQAQAYYCNDIEFKGECNYLFADTYSTTYEINYLNHGVSSDDAIYMRSLSLKKGYAIRVFSSQLGRGSMIERRGPLKFTQFLGMPIESLQIYKLETGTAGYVTSEENSQGFFFYLNESVPDTHEEFRYIIRTVHSNGPTTVALYADADYIFIDFNNYYVLEPGETVNVQRRLDDTLRSIRVGSLDP